VALFISTILLTFTGCGGGNEDDNRGPTVDVTGTWTGTWASADASGDFNFVMTQIGNNVEGINTRLGRFTGNVQANIFYIDGTDVYAIVNGDDISGTYTGNTGEVVSFSCERTGGSFTSATTTTTP
jgi:hypothetical protein